MKKLICIFLAAVLFLLFASCRSTSIASLPPVHSVPQSSSASLPASSRPQPPPPKPQPQPEPLLPQYLTGLQRGEDYHNARRITAVMLDNFAKHRPQRGMSEADVVFEILTEGGITRFMCLYANYETIPVVGPIRSARDQFFQLLMAYQGFYVHDGQSQPTSQMFEDWEYSDYNMDTGMFGNDTQDAADLTRLAWRDAGLIADGASYESTEFTDGAHIAATIDNNNLKDYRTYDGSTIFNFVPYDEPARLPSGGMAGKLTVMHSEHNYMTYFEYSAPQSAYLMSMYNSFEDKLEPTIDENNLKQLAFENVIVLFAPMQMYEGTTLPKFDYGVGGVGYYFSKGRYELLRWEKGSPNAALFLFDYDDTEEPLLVNTGKSYVAVIDDLYLPGFDAAVRLGTIGDVINEGNADTDPVDTT